jgi:antirestriction protein ArdC
MKPWNAGNTGGHATAQVQLRAVLMHQHPDGCGPNLCARLHYSTWMMFWQASGLNAHVRKGEKGSRSPSRARKRTSTAKSRSDSLHEGLYRV